MPTRVLLGRVVKAGGRTREQQPLPRAEHTQGPRGGDLRLWRSWGTSEGRPGLAPFPAGTQPVGLCGTSVGKCTGPCARHTGDTSWRAAAALVHGAGPGLGTTRPPYQWQAAPSDTHLRAAPRGIYDVCGFDQVHRRPRGPGLSPKKLVFFTHEIDGVKGRRGDTVRPASFPALTLPRSTPPGSPVPPLNPFLALCPILWGD